MTIAAYAIIGMVAIAAWFAAVQMGRNACFRWGEITGREVQYRRVSYASECFVKTSDGKWLPRDAIREVVE